MPLKELTATARYPEDSRSVHSLYDTGTKFVRYLFSKYPAQCFPQFVDHVLGGAPVATALVEIYGDEFRDLAAFDKRFQTSIR